MNIKHGEKQFRTIVKIVGKAINSYAMIKEGDNVLLALSGGKDSLVLLDTLCRRLKHIPIFYNLYCCHVHVTNFADDTALEKLHTICSQYSVPLIVKNITVDFSKKDISPCFVCARYRRKMLFDTAAEHNCNKIAFGHNQDDIIITFLMNMMYNGKLSTMPPKLTMFNGTLDIIRPLAFLTEEQIKGYCTQRSIVPIENDCPYKDSTKRQQTKELFQHIQQSVRGARSSIFRSLSTKQDEYLL